MSESYLSENSIVYHAYDDYVAELDALEAAIAADEAEDERLWAEADAEQDAEAYDPYETTEDPLAGSCDPTGGFPR